MADPNNLTAAPALAVQGHANPPLGTPIPLAALAPIPRWVAWQTEERTPGGKPTKVPYAPNGRSEKASSKDPQTWGTRAAAEASAARLPRPFGHGGVGLQLGDLGDGRALGGVDLDTCRNSDGTLVPWAMEVVSRLGSYTEVSPSNTGVKIFFVYASGELPALRAVMKTDHGKAWKRPGAGEHPPAIELYLGARYFAVTEEHLAGTPPDLRPVAADTLLWLIQTAGPAFVGAGRPADTSQPAGGTTAATEGTVGLIDRIKGCMVSNPLLARRWARDWSGLTDASASARAMSLGAVLKGAGFDKAEMIEALKLHLDTADWACTKGSALAERELNRIWDRAADDTAKLLAHPDMTVTRLNRRPPPALPLEAFGPFWSGFIERAAEAAACPPDYVVPLLLSGASCLIGHARWAQGSPGWVEPPHLWTCAVGDSGGGKSPGGDALLRDVLPELERRMAAGFPERYQTWQLQLADHKFETELWHKSRRKTRKTGTEPIPPRVPQVFLPSSPAWEEIREKSKAGTNYPSISPSKGAPPLGVFPLGVAQQPAAEPPQEPQRPRLCQTDVTIERVASLLATAAPKGLLIVRDELTGWLQGMNAYHEGGRAFWLECYGGRPYRVERQKHPQPIDVPRLAVAVFGGTQPDKLGEMMKDADDGLLARFGWFWPDPVPFDLSQAVPGVDEAIAALDRLRLLELVPPRPANEPPQPPQPGLIPLAPEAQELMRDFGRDMQARQREAGGLMVSALGKARGTALRLALVLEYLWWCGAAGDTPPPTTISASAFKTATQFVADYLMPMAERVYGDAVTRPEDRNAATLARHILRERPTEVHVRTLQRKIHLPGLGQAPEIHAACPALIEAGWLREPEGGTEFQQRTRAAYRVNPKVWEVAP